MSLKTVTITIPSEILEEIDRRNNGVVTRSRSMQKALYQIFSNEATINSLFPKQESMYKKYFEENIIPKLNEQATEEQTKKEYLVGSSDTSITVSNSVDLIKQE